MRKPNKNKMAGENSRFASVSPVFFNGFLLKMLLRSLPVYILKQLFFSISVNSGRIFTEPRIITRRCTIVKPLKTISQLLYVVKQKYSPGKKIAPILPLVKAVDDAK